MMDDKLTVELDSNMNSSMRIDSNSGKIFVNPNATCASYSTTWEEILRDLPQNTVKSMMDDEELKKRVSEKINEVLNEDDTIEIMKKYLLKFIEENIDNPENLIKEFLASRDEELNKCKEELSKCREEIGQLKDYIRTLLLTPATTNPYIPYPSPYTPLTSTPDITWTNNTSISC